jgi:pimeloyl-ACP methyl ester carboxylesterase
MDHLRTYGRPPFTTAVVHGGPGAAGEMAPVARRLARRRGVLEPLQTAGTLNGQIEELRSTLEEYAALPVALIGYSWGAWLSWILAARFPALVRKLVLVSSGPFEDRCAAQIQETRLSRLTVNEQQEYLSAIEMLSNPQCPKPETLGRLGRLAAKADAFDPLQDEDSETVDLQPAIFQQVWGEAAAMRKSGKLLALADRIACPVAAIHGSHDPHPADCVQIPLSEKLPDFKMYLLKHCGHKPWIERQAVERFYAVLEDELEET